MTVKVIVTDMDGTFLNDAKTYDRSRFLAQFAQLQQRGIEFVVASGNQYYQLISFFPEIREQISFVAENGALVYEHGTQLFHGELTRHESQVVIGELLKDPQLNFVACGLQSAYVSDKAPDAFVELMSKHYHRLQRVSDYHAIDDTLFKFSLNLPDSEIPQLIDKLHVSLDGIMKPVTSGFGFVDLIIPGLHKANGISRLLKRWDLSPQQCVAIGDSGNDAEMLKLVKYAFAMGNAADSIKAIAGYATDNRHFTDAAWAQEAHVDPHKQGDRHRRADGKHAPRAFRQRFHHDERQHREDDDHNQEAAEQGDRARNRPHLLFNHLTQRGAVTPRGDKQHHEVLYRARQHHAGQQPQGTRQITHLRGQYRADQRAGAGDRGKVVAKQHVAVGWHIVQAIVINDRRRGARRVKLHHLLRDVQAVITVGDEVHRNRCDDDPQGTDVLTAAQGDD